MIVKTQYVEFNELSVKLYTVLITMCHHSVDTLEGIFSWPATVKKTGTLLPGIEMFLFLLGLYSPCTQLCGSEMLLSFIHV